MIRHESLEAVHTHTHTHTHRYFIKEIENLKEEVEKYNGRIKDDKTEFPVIVTIDGYGCR